MTELQKALVIGRATYERWLGTEPHEIEAAAAALRDQDLQHAMLVDLEIRCRRARQLKTLLEAAAAAVARSTA
jgi:hypothetical protein